MRLLDVKMVAARLNVGTTTVYRMLKGGHIGFVKVGPRKGYRVTVDSVDRLVRSGFSVPRVDDID